tara:strand:+ start:664 stop:1083 length:420 start_codon:yes stop_codon:yes gene_type:complete
MGLRILLTISVISSLGSFFARPVLASSKFTVYCSSNMDGTGVCNKEESSEPIHCLILPGSIIGCKSDNTQFRCIRFGQVIAHQAQFSCQAVEPSSASPQQTGEARTTAIDLDKKQSSPNPYFQQQPNSVSDINIPDGIF